MQTINPDFTPTLTGLPPLIDSGVKVLILGSFPGGASLAALQYYAHPRNHFWRLLSAVLNNDLAALPYADRLPRLLQHRIGLWDVLGGCDRVGSLDSAIRNPLANDFNMLRDECPQVQRVCFNGKTSGSHAPWFAAAGYDTLVLPSSSPANAKWSFERKLAAWRGIIHNIPPA